MSTQMTTSAAKVLIAKLHEEGLTNAEIAKRLRDRGYVARGKNGQAEPISAFGVGYHVRALKEGKVNIKLAAAQEQKAGPTSPSHVAYRPANDKIRLAIEILNSNLDESAKEAAAKAILNS